MWLRAYFCRAYRCTRVFLPSQQIKLKHFRMTRKVTFSVPSLLYSMYTVRGRYAALLTTRPSASQLKKIYPVCVYCKYCRHRFTSAYQQQIFEGINGCFSKAASRPFLPTIPAPRSKSRGLNWNICLPHLYTSAPAPHNCWPAPTKKKNQLERRRQYFSWKKPIHSPIRALRWLGASLSFQD